MKHRMATTIDWIILKPVAVLYAPAFILYGIFSKNGGVIHIVLGIAGIFIAGLIGQVLYPKATPDDLLSGRAWEGIGPDNEKNSQNINVDIRQIKIKNNRYN